MKPKTKSNMKSQAEINMVLAAGAPETQTKHGHKGFGSVSDKSGLCVGATIEADVLINDLMKKVHEMDSRVKKHIESYVIEYLALATPPLIVKKLSNELYSKIKWRGIKLVRKEDSFLPGMHYSIWLEQRGKRLGQVIRVYYSDTCTCNIQIHSNE